MITHQDDKADVPASGSLFVWLLLSFMLIASGFACDDQAQSQREQNAGTEQDDMMSLDGGIIDLEGGEESPDVSVALEDSGGVIDMRDPDESEDLTDELFRTDRLLQVSITMNEADWDDLRAQSRSIFDLFRGRECLDQPFGSVFTWFEASITLDGETYPRVEVRKKGFIGSLSEEKPSLKVDLGEFEEGQTHLGARRLTLNNSVQDPSLIRQCLGYEIIESAGIPSPRCNFAHVEVNGESLGVYVNIEPYKRPFFERTFGSYEGNLYEGTISDFTERGINTFEPKNNDEDRPELPDLLAVQTALTAGDNQLMDRLDEVIDLDQFMRFWALESLLLHSDGYSGNRNNFYLYGDPELGGRFQFLLWGIDGILGSYNVAEEEPTSVYRRGTLAWRLYQIPEARTRYFEALDELLETVWDEEQLLARVDEMRTSLLEWVEDAAERDRLIGEIAEVSTVISTRRDEIMRERSAGAPDGGDEMGGPACLVKFGSVSSSFNTAWGVINQDPAMWFAQEGQSLEIIFTGEDESVIRAVGSAAGTDEQFGPRLNILGSLGLNNYFLLNVSLDEENWRSGMQNVWSEIYYSGVESGYEIVYIASAYVELSLERGGAEEGDPIIGTLSGDILGWQE